MQKIFKLIFSFASIAGGVANMFVSQGACPIYIVSASAMVRKLFCNFINENTKTERSRLVGNFETFDARNWGILLCARWRLGIWRTVGFFCRVGHLHYFCMFLVKKEMFLRQLPMAVLLVGLICGKSFEWVKSTPYSRFTHLAWSKCPFCRLYFIFGFCGRNFDAF